MSDKYDKLREKLYKMYNEKDKSDFIGSTKKFECDIKGVHGLFKERISMQSKDHIMEEVAYRLASIVGVRCCEASCRKVQDLYGSFSKFEIADISKLTNFTQLLGSKELWTEDIISRVIQLAGVNSKFTLDVYKVLIFDFIVGQIDRHMDNLAIYNDGRVIHLYPLYDNGLCCFSSFSNDTAIQCLNNGFYSSRNGNDVEIYDALKYYRNIYHGDLRDIIYYHRINYDVLNSIIDKSNKYNQLSAKRKEATIQFILKQVYRVHELNLGVTL